MTRRGKVTEILRPRHILICLAVCLLLLAGVAVSQEGKLQEIYELQGVLHETRESLLLEEQRLMHMLEYVQTDEYLQQYAREKFGYLGPEDYKFYMEDGTTAPIPASPSPAEQEQPEQAPPEQAPPEQPPAE